MPKENYTHICFVIDRSGSMSNIAKDMRGGFDEAIKEQQCQIEDLKIIVNKQQEQINELLKLIK